MPTFREWIASLTRVVPDGGELVPVIDQDGHTKAVLVSDIEAGASGSLTAAQILAKLKTVDGPGSGLDADLLDGQHASDISAGVENLLWVTGLTDVPPAESILVPVVTASGAHKTDEAALLDSAAKKSANLSDLTDGPTARTNLGLGTAATHPATDFDVSGAASTAQGAAISAAATDATTKANNAQSAATAASATDATTKANNAQAAAIAASDALGSAVAMAIVFS